MGKTLSQLEKEYYQQSGFGSRYINDNKKALFSRETGMKYIGQGEILYLKKFISDNGGDVSNLKYIGDVWKAAVAATGQAASRYINENKRLFYSSPNAQLQFFVENLPGLLAYYPLNETTGTTAFNRANGTIGTLNGTVSNATIGQPGAVGKAYSFDGVGDRVIIPSIVPANTFSFAFAFKRNGTPDANDRVIDQASGGPTLGWHIQADADGNIGLRTWNAGGASLSLNFGIIADDTWYVFGGSIGASSSKLYLNGVEVASGGGNSFGTGVVADLQFGARSGGTSNPMTGSLQHVMIATGQQWSAEIQEDISNFFFNLTSNRLLRVNGEPYRIRGWNYSSNYLGGSSTNPWYIESGQIPFDMADIREAGMNVVKIYADENNPSLHLAALDIVQSYGLKAIVLRFITYDTDYSVATGGANRTAAIAKFTGMITNLKSHPAIIGWGFGNENNLVGNRDDGTTAADWYSLLNAACGAGKAIDTSRFYFTADADLGTYPGDGSLTNLDVLGLNIYRGTTITDLPVDIIAATSKPCIITEFGRKRADNTAPNQATQSSEVVGLLQFIESQFPIIAGWVHFKFTHTSIVDTGDEFWEATAPLADDVTQARTRFAEYDGIKNFNLANNHE